MEDERKTKKQLIEELNALRLEKIEQTTITREKYTKAFLQNSIPVAITTVKEGRFVEVSDAFLVFMECKRDEVIGHTAAEIGFITEGHRSSFLDELKKSGRIENLEVRFQTKNGVLRHGLFNAVMMNLGKEKYLLSVMTDITARKQTEEALRESEDKYRRITDNMSDIVVELDAQGIITYISPSNYRIFGGNHNAQIGKSAFDSIHPDDRERVMAQYMEGVRTKTDREVEYRYQHTDGHYIWLRSIGHSMFDAAGELAGMIVSSSVINERKQVEEVLKQVNERLLLATTAGGVGIWGLNVVNNKLTWDDQMFRLYGIKPENFGGAYETWQAGVHPEDAERSNAEVQMALRGEKEFNTEFRVVWPDGTIRHIAAHANVHCNALGQPTELLGTNYDITARKQMEESLRKSEANYRQLFDNSPAAIYQVDFRTGKFLKANDLICEYLGCSQEEITSLSPYDSMTKESKQYFSERLEKMSFREKVTENPEFEIVDKNGKRRWLQLNAKNIYDSEGLAGADVVAHDITERKQTEEALRESEKRYRELTNFVPISIFEVDAMGSLISWNSTALEVFRYNEEDSKKGMNALQFFVPEELQRVGEKMEKVMQGTSTPGQEFTFLRKDGSTFSGLIFSAPNIQQNKAVGIKGAVIDISDRKRVEEALRESEEKYRTLVENASDMVYRTDENGYFTFANPAGLRITGYKEEEIIGKHYKMFIRPDMFKETITFFANQLINKIQNTYHEYPIITKDGKELWFGQNMQLITEEDKVTGFQAVARDITDRKLAEDKLRDSETRFRQLANSTWEGIFIHRDGIILDVNQALTDIFGYDKAEAIGKNVLDFIAPEFTEKAVEILKEGDQSSALQVEGKGRKKDGTVFPIETLGRPITYNNLPARVIAIRDLTQQKQLEEARAKIEAQNRQLQKSESLSRMAASIAHHFNNQLGVVIGNLEMAIDEQPKGVPPARSLTAAMEAAWKSADMSGLMLTYLGQTHDKREPLDLSYSCRKMLPLIKATLPENVVMETDFPLPRPTIMANAGEIQQILNNLITNAWEAIGKNNGSISLSVKTVSPAEIPAAHLRPIGWQPQNNAYACLEVADTGSGIDNKDIEQLFDPFFTDKFTGRGMGLAVVLGIVKAYKGAITVDSKPGSGSTFRLFFPVSEEALPQPQAAENDREVSISSPSTKKMEEGGTVLVVEDEEPLRKMVAIMLARLGFTALEAKDGIEALEVFGKYQSEISFVLSDLTMPRMGGWETLTELRKLQPDIAVILASGYDKAHVMEGDHPELPQAFLAKPYNLKVLRAAISQALESRRK